MENLTKLLAEVKDRPLEISETKTGEIIKTSQRNQLRTDIMTALLADIISRLDALDGGAS